MSSTVSSSSSSSAQPRFSMQPHQQQHSHSPSIHNRYSLPTSISSTSLANKQVNRISSIPTGSSIAGDVSHVSILDRPISKTLRSEVALSAFAFMFSEAVSYAQSRVDSIGELESRLASLGHHVGTRLLSLLLVRNTNGNANLMKDPKREIRLIPVLQFIHTQIYRAAFGRPADGLEKSFGAEDEYMISLNSPPLTQHISIPKDMSQLSCEAFTAGLVEGVLDGLDFPAKATAHTVPSEGFPNRSVVLIRLGKEVMDREASLGK